VILSLKKKPKSEEEIAKLIKEQHDSDIVLDMGLCEDPSSLTLRISRKTKNHIIYDTGNGMGIIHVFCKHKKRLYKHKIQVPNKNDLICRGCGAEI
jgi:hypothetical protein